MDGSTPGFPVLHHLLELAQTQVHRVDDANNTPLYGYTTFCLSIDQSTDEHLDYFHILAIMDGAAINIHAWAFV